MPWVSPIARLHGEILALGVLGQRVERGVDEHEDKQRREQQHRDRIGDPTDDERQHAETGGYHWTVHAGAPGEPERTGPGAAGDPGPDRPGTPYLAYQVFM